MPNYGPGPTEEAIRQLKVPAITILIMAAITTLVRIGGMALDLSMMGQVAPQQQTFFFSAMIGNGIAMFLNIITAAGAWKMWRAESYSFAMTAAIISVIPVCSPCL